MQASRNVFSAIRKINVSKFAALIKAYASADSTPRYSVDLRTATVSKSELSNGDRVIEIEDKEKETIQVLFEDPNEFKKWGLVFAESRKDNAELRKSQIIEPLREKMHRDRLRKSENDIDKRIKDQKEERAKLRSKNKRVYLGRFVEEVEPSVKWSEEAKKA